MKHLFTIFLALTGFLLQGQRITVSLPHFAGKEYIWFACNGDKQDTITQGVLDGKGKTVLTVPATYKGWQGMSNFLLNEGGGLEIILNNEGDFTAGCDVAEPTISDIYYKGSAENSFLLEQYMEQQRLMNRASAISAAVWEYTPNEPLYPILLKEKERLEKEYADLQQQIAESPLYAARIREMADYCQGLGSRLDLKEEEVMAEQRRYMREVVDFEQLWYSGMWRHVLGHWMGESEETLVEDGRGMLLRLRSATGEEEKRRNGEMDIYDKLVRKVTSLFYQYGKEGLLLELGVEDVCAPGHEAPKLYFSNGSKIVPFNTLVFFYESDCNSCENELLRLRGNYPIFQEKGIRIISVSADKNEAVFQKNADLFMWDHKLCDFKGFEGVNFKNYGVIGTPMIFLIDKNGIIKGRYAQVEEVLKEI